MFALYKYQPMSLHLIIHHTSAHCISDVSTVCEKLIKDGAVLVDTRHPLDPTCKLYQLSSTGYQSLTNILQKVVLDDGRQSKDAHVNLLRNRETVFLFDVLLGWVTVEECLNTNDRICITAEQFNINFRDVSHALDDFHLNSQTPSSCTQQVKCTDCGTDRAEDEPNRQTSVKSMLSGKLELKLVLDSVTNKRIHTKRRMSMSYTNCILYTLFLRDVVRKNDNGWYLILTPTVYVPTTDSTVLGYKRMKKTDALSSNFC
jgi:hypothetical protein